MKPFHEVKVHEVAAGFLKAELGSRGYVLLRGVLPCADVSYALREVTYELFSAGWLLPGHDPCECIADVSAACGDPDPSFKRTYQEVFNLEAFHALPHHDALKRIMRMIVGEQVLIHPKPIGRLIFPRCEQLRVRAHQDYRFMSGDPECFTVWIPLHDCPSDVGPLQILEGSHRLGFLDHEDEHLHVPEIPPGPAMQGDWVGGQINAGDVLIFHSLTVHAAGYNRSDRLRVSLDCRFQNYGRAINPANLAFGGESGKSWETTYSRWRSNELKYYWKRLPLKLQPTKSEIEALARTAEPPSLRARYCRIMNQLD